MRNGNDDDDRELPVSVRPPLSEPSLAVRPPAELVAHTDEPPPSIRMAAQASCPPPNEGPAKASSVPPRVVPAKG
jgi:hypothetical protein